MPESIKILGQVAPAAATLSPLYTVPAATEAVVSTIVVCNRGSSGANFRVASAPLGEADNPKHYNYFDCPIAPGETFGCLPMTLSATDVIRVQADTANVSFIAYGSEIT